MFNNRTTDGRNNICGINVAKLRKALKGYTEGATVLIVAQRVSTIMHAEQIVVLDEGRVMGIGTHRELLARCKTYREIAESQLSKEELA